MVTSFSWTSAALVAGRKTCTRRSWDSRWGRAFTAGRQIAAYDRRPSFGGKQIAVIELTADAYREPLALMPESDYEAEGWAFYAEHPEARPKTILGGRVDAATFTREGFERWRRSGGEMWVVRFKLLEVC